MGKWADIASRVQAPEPHVISAISADSSTEVASGATNPPPALDSEGRRRSANEARSVLRNWRDRLRMLDPDQPLGALNQARWRRLCEDAAWIFTRHGEKLAQEGWSELDVFGVSMRRPGGEVLLDRLDGARSLLIEAEGRAVWSWSYTSVTMQTSRGYAGRVPAGSIAPLWAVTGDPLASSGVAHG
jgi:hypothetical protein